MSQTQTDMEKLKAWLSTCPYWEEVPQLDCIWAGNSVLPKGLEEISRQTDVLGNTTVGCRYQITLFWQLPGQGNQEEDTEKLLKFIQWIQFQSASGFAPQFGDVPARERIRTEKGGLTPGTQTVTYTLTLIVDFIKIYEVNK